MTTGWSSSVAGHRAWPCVTGERGPEGQGTNTERTQPSALSLNSW